MTVNISGGKTALVLAGGGITGAVYEIGALRAIDDLLVDRSVNDFDIYVGTSAGAFVLAYLANGISPERLLQTLDSRDPSIEPFKRENVFSINYKNLARWSLGLPKRLRSAWRDYLSHIQEMTLFDLLWLFSETIPDGMYDNTALEQFLRLSLMQLGKSNRFEDLDKELYIVATDINNGERTVFGRGNKETTPISLAVAASTALPLMYRPIEIENSEYVDGGLRGNASIDLAIEHGADLVVCINPLVPFNIQQYGFDDKSPSGQTSRHRRNVQTIANQALRITTHAGLHYHIKQLRRSNPQVDIILIEPGSENHPMFLDNIMRYSVRLEVARYGFESVTLDLAKDYVYYKHILARHGIPLSRRLVIEEINAIQQSGYDPETIRKILEARRSICSNRNLSSPACRLDRILTRLELAIEADAGLQQND